MWRRKKKKKIPASLKGKGVRVMSIWGEGEHKSGLPRDETDLPLLEKWALLFSSNPPQNVLSSSLFVIHIFFLLNIAMRVGLASEHNNYQTLVLKTMVVRKMGRWEENSCNFLELWLYSYVKGERESIKINEKSLDYKALKLIQNSSPNTW